MGLEKFVVSCKKCSSIKVIAERRFNSKVNDLFLKCEDCNEEEKLRKLKDEP